MAYSYGTQGAPAVGGGAPGLPKRWQPAASTYTRIVSGSGVLIPPQGAKFMRVAVIGGGGGGRAAASNMSGGGGGGCAASKITIAALITYSIGNAGVGNTSNGGNTTAGFLNYSLVGGGGFLGGLTGGQGGTGIGGDYNFNGGSSYSGNYSGGGAAGPNGNGGDVGLNAVLSNYGWGVGGGGGGASINVGGATVYSGGGGTGAQSGAVYSEATGGSTVSPVFYYPGTVWGKPSLPKSVLNYDGLSAGGEMGGGGCGGYMDANKDTVNEYTTTDGGSGGMVVEWFY